MSSSEEYWEKKKEGLETLIRKEFDRLQQDLTLAREKIQLGIYHNDFLSVFKHTIDMSASMLQIYAVVKFTKGLTSVKRKAGEIPNNIPTEDS